MSEAEGSFLPEDEEEDVIPRAASMACVEEDGAAEVNEKEDFAAGAGAEGEPTANEAGASTIALVPGAGA